MLRSDYHIPVLLKESIEALDINPEGNYVDLTFGGGGHSRKILEQLTSGKLYAFDQDSDSEKIATDLSKSHPNLIFYKTNFKNFKDELENANIKIDGLLADLGVSSHQIDSDIRGFSYRYDSLLDMRMSQDSDITAIDVINDYPREKLINIFKYYGEIKNSARLANIIILKRLQSKIKTTAQLKEIAYTIAPKFKENKYLSKIFQAIRIEVNDEIGVLKKMLSDAPEILKKNGRIVVISYHSIEDRLVKNFFKFGNFEGNPIKDIYGNLLRPLNNITRKVIIPSEEEIESNKRSRSAKMRIAEKI